MTRVAPRSRTAQPFPQSPVDRAPSREADEVHSHATGDGFEAPRPGLVATREGIALASPPPGASIALLPAVQIAGKWYGGRRARAIEVDGDTLIADAGDAGKLFAEVRGSEVEVRFVAAADCVVEKLKLEGSVELPGATAWLSNGFQSWSQSGVMRLAPPPSEKALSKALLAEGEAEVYRRGREFSSGYTYVGGGEYSLVAGATTADRLRSYIQANIAPHRSDGPLRLRLVNGAGEKVRLSAGEALRGEPWMVQIGSDLGGMLERYGRAFERRTTDALMPRRVGWNSWYNLFDDVHAQDLLERGAQRNVDLLPERLGRHLPVEGAPPYTFVIDDGWQKSWGDWTPNAKFADLDGLVADLKARGHAAGIWIAPLLVDPKSDVARQHPEWLVGGTSFEHPVHGEMRVLDVTRPEAAAHLGEVIGGLVNAGMSLLKLDFLFAGTQEGQRAEDVTGLQAYNRALEIIRGAAGEETFLTACGAPAIPSMKYTDNWRVGNDIGFRLLFGLHHPGGPFFANQLRQYAARIPYCLDGFCDTDPLLLEESNLSPAEVEARGWLAVMPGGGLFLSDALEGLCDAKLDRAIDRSKVELALSGRHAVPEDYFPAKVPHRLGNMVDSFFRFADQHHAPEVFRMGDGRRVAFNATSKPKEIEGETVPAYGARELPRQKDPEARSASALGPHVTRTMAHPRTNRRTPASAALPPPHVARLSLV